ncbi:MAG: magnesium transporter [Candidatus Hadarchaeales archaeon]
MKGEIKRIVTQGLMVLIPCAMIEIFAGNTLEAMKEELTLTIPALIIMIPPLLDLRGNIGGALASRLGTALHIGAIESKNYFSKEMTANILSAVILSILASATIGIISSLLGAVLGRSVNVLLLLFIAIVSSFLSGLILTFMTVFVSILSYKHGWDPDNVVAPLIATAGDYLTIVCIFITVILVV